MCFSMFFLEYDLTNNDQDDQERMRERFESFCSLVFDFTM